MAPDVGFVYRATVERVVDGDTLDLVVDVGFRVLRRDRFRLVLGDGTPYDAPESRGPKVTSAGRAAAEWLKTELPAGAAVVVRTFRGADKYGRWLAAIWLDGDGADIASRMLAAGWGQTVEAWR